MPVDTIHPPTENYLSQRQDKESGKNPSEKGFIGYFLDNSGDVE